MKRGLRKKGSSLVAVLVIFTIILVTATTMIGVATSNVRMRVNQSKRLQNLYNADSGLEVFNNIIFKDMEAAVRYSQKEVLNSDIFNNSIGDAIDEKVYNDLNKEFKTLFMKSLIAGSGVQINKNGIPGEQIIDKSFVENAKDITYDANGEYRDTELGTENPTLFVSFKNYGFVNEINKNQSNREVTYKKAFSGEKPKIEVSDIKYYDVDKKLEFKVTSTFVSISKESASASVSKFQNKKVIETSFTITAPEYEDVISRTNQFDVAKVSVGPLAIDGNLNIENDLEIIGNAWVKGNADTSSNKDQSIVFSKYNGGITVASEKNLKITGDIYTASTLAMVNGSEVNITGKLYSGNTYIGPSRTIDSSSSGNTLDVGTMITYNDLGINSINTTVNMDNYYGINSVISDEKNSGKYNASKRSSCIIVNNYNGQNELKINQNAYIAGVAYIDTGDENIGEYETGESIAVRGNYKAYQEALTSIDGNEITPGFKYYNPVQLLETIDGNKATVEDKKKYFNSYYKDREGELKTAGITIGKVHSTGAFVNKDGNTGVFDDVDLNNERKAYASKVFAMNSNLKDDDAMATYNKGVVAQSVKGDKDVTALINFNGMGNEIGISDKGIENSTSGAIYAKVEDENKTVVISKDYIYFEDDYDNSKKEFQEKGVIITKGDVIIKPGVEFTGSILAGGNVIIESGDEKVELRYDKELVGKIIGRNNLNQYFNAEAKVETITASTGDKITADPNTTNSYNVANSVKNGLWKLNK